MSLNLSPHSFSSLISYFSWLSFLLSLSVLFILIGIHRGRGANSATGASQRARIRVKQLEHPEMTGSNSVDREMAPVAVGEARGGRDGDGSNVGLWQ